MGLRGEAPWVVSWLPGSTSGNAKGIGGMFHEKRSHGMGKGPGHTLTPSGAPLLPGPFKRDREREQQRELSVTGYGEQGRSFPPQLFPVIEPREHTKGLLERSKGSSCPGWSGWLVGLSQWTTCCPSEGAHKQNGSRARPASSEAHQDSKGNWIPFVKEERSPPRLDASILP